MRRALIVVGLLLLWTGLVAGGVVRYGNLEFHDVTTVEELNRLISEHNGEYFFLFYHSETCPACSYMKERVFSTREAAEALEDFVRVSVDVYRGRELTNLRYRVDGRVLVIQPDNAGYYLPKKPGEEINVGVPGTPTMVIFKAENGTRVLKGVAVGALQPEGLKLFVERSIGSGKRGSNSTATSSNTPGEKINQPRGEKTKPNLTLGVLLTVFSAGILSVFSPCVLPVVVGALTLTFARRNVEAIVAGMVVSFALLGALVGSLGSYASQIQGALYLIGGLGFIGIGVTLVSERASAKLERFLSFSPTDRVAFRGGIAYDFLLGSALGATWLGCIAPYVGFAVITAALSGDVVSGMIVMGTYGLGMGLTVYLLMSSKDLGEWVNRKLFSGKLGLEGRKKARWEVALGVILISLGLLMLTELTPLKFWSTLFEALS
ncbi:cytochrome c biogenesis protein CcdA [Thermococcus sp.]|uniref:thioredoxin fold domain-containing protein n=1 Tax=Thermococcus sp. TaxID=35749 RepID=UPI00261844B3|nr:cytochrome c biogenesis protein CcdA [Thermococcus sp.]